MRKIIYKNAEKSRTRKQGESALQWGKTRYFSWGTNKCLSKKFRIKMTEKWCKSRSWQNLAYGSFLPAALIFVWCQKLPELCLGFLSTKESGWHKGLISKHAVRWVTLQSLQSTTSLVWRGWIVRAGEMQLPYRPAPAEISFNRIDTVKNLLDFWFNISFEPFQFLTQLI